MFVFLIRCLGSWVHQIHKHHTLFPFCFLLSFSFSSPNCSLPPFFPFLLSFFFFFLFLPLSWCLAFLNSLYLLILLKPKPKPICLKLLSQINGSLSLAFFFLWVSVHMVLPTCRGEVEGVGLWGSAWWRVWVCSDWHLWWSFGDGTDQSLGQSVMGCMIVRWLDQ